MRIKIIFIIFISLFLMGFLGCEVPEEKATVNYMLSIMGPLASLSNEAPLQEASDYEYSSMPSSITSAIKSLNTLESQSVKNTLKAMGMEALVTNEEVLGPGLDLSGPNKDSWYTLVIDESVFAEEEIIANMTVMGRLTLNNSPITVTLDLDNPENMEAEFEAKLPAQDDLTSAKVELTAKGKSNREELSSFSASTTLEVINTETVTTIGLDFMFSGKSTVTDVKCKFRFEAGYLIDINELEISGMTSYTISVGFLYLDSYNCTSNFRPDGTVDGTVSHNSLVVEFEIDKEGVGTYYYEGEEYPIENIIEVEF